MKQSKREGWSAAIPLAALLVALISGGRAPAQEPKVDVEIQGTAAPEDDYVTWGPAGCRIKLHDALPAGSAPLKVVLKNGPDAPIVPPRTTPPNGKLGFAASVAPGAAPTGDSLPLDLPADGSWVDFVIAGTRASTGAKDAAVEVRKETADGAQLSTTPVMVRVRKDLAKLEAVERTAFLDAIRRIHVERNRYVDYFRTHARASFHLPDWPDQAHRGPGFMPWHRTFILRFERELQTIDPTVSVHYWRADVDASQTVFTPAFMGANGAGGDDLVAFSPGHPLEGWRVDDEEITRGPQDRSAVASILTAYNSAIGSPPAYKTFATRNEFALHNNLHGWLGGVHFSCQTTVADPMFFSFHCYIDWNWAQWQRKNNRFANVAPAIDAYAPAGSYLAGGTVTKGHYLLDTMWPWDQTQGGGAPGDLANRPSGPPSDTPFPPAAVPGTWPGADPGKPRPVDVIDYLNCTATTRPLGYCYDSVPFGAAAAQHGAVAPAEVSTAVLLRTLADSNAAPESRARAARTLVGRAEADAAAIETQVEDPVLDPEIRRESLNALGTIDSSRAIDAALRILGEKPEAAKAGLRVAALNQASVLVAFTREGRPRSANVLDAAKRSLQSADENERAAAARLLFARKDPAADEALAQAIQNPAANPGWTVRLLKLAPLPVLRALEGRIRPLLASQDQGVRWEAAAALTPDAQSRAKVREMVESEDATEAPRLRVLARLAHDDPGFNETARKILDKSTAPDSLKAAVSRLVATHVSLRRAEIGKQNVEAVRASLERVVAGGGAKSAPAAKAALATIDEVTRGAK